ncbi:MAG: metallophosphatase family protein [Dysgonamonadaceae bacterium]|jgi:putative phosphoesterase|nr:metallophosphatase family protein [Dysgonamonadaceae bacterium]
MKKIGLLSDTHGYWDEKFKKYFAECDEIWHAGDIGSEDVINNLQQIAEVRAVHGNIDNTVMRRLCPEVLQFRVENIDVLMTHVGGYPSRFASSIVPRIIEFKPKLFICGHSHILKIMYDKSFAMLCLNPGESQRYPRNGKRTLLRFVIDGENIRDMEIIELS